MRDAVVVGAGHAGVEAAMSLAHAGKDTVLITINLEHIAKMPCNPSVGGPAKGIVVREIDALGGVMPKVADKTALQFKMLNTTKDVKVHDVVITFLGYNPSDSGYGLAFVVRADEEGVFLKDTFEFANNNNCQIYKAIYDDHFKGWVYSK